MMRASFALTLAIAFAGSLWALAVGEDGGLKVEKVSFKASFVKEGEKAARVRLTADESTIGQVAQKEVTVLSSDTVGAQVAVVDGEGESAAVEQAFLRFVNWRTGKDNLYLMRKRGLDIKVDLDLKREIRADGEFWTGGDAYRVEVVIGDGRMARGFTWVVAEGMRFEDGEADVFAPRKRGVFDFDVGVKRGLQAEFEFPIPEGERRAAIPAVAVGLAAVIAPLPVLVGVWGKMGVLGGSGGSGKGLGVVVGLQVCVMAHMVAMILFWVKWDIVTTWKVMGVLMVPTLALVRAFLREENVDGGEKGGR